MKLWTKALDVFNLCKIILSFISVINNFFNLSPRNYCNAKKKVLCDNNGQGLMKVLMKSLTITVWSKSQSIGIISHNSVISVGGLRAEGGGRRAWIWRPVMKEKRGVNLKTWWVLINTIKTNSGARRLISGRIGFRNVLIKYKLSNNNQVVIYKIILYFDSKKYNI